jgi:hypothetical protein
MQSARITKRMSARFIGWPSPCMLYMLRMLFDRS